ncbi:MAG: hypothetical protein AAGD01_16125 [Acidobacteriota bacterium]
MKSVALESQAPDLAQERSAHDVRSMTQGGQRPAAGRAAPGLAGGALRLASVPVLPPDGAGAGPAPTVQRARRNHKGSARKRRAQKKAERQRKKKAESQGKEYRNPKQRRQDRQAKAEARARRPKPSRAQRREAHQERMQAAMERFEKRQRVCENFFSIAKKAGKNWSRTTLVVDQVVAAAGLDEMDPDRVHWRVRQLMAEFDQQVAAVIQRQPRAQEAMGRGKGSLGRFEASPMKLSRSQRIARRSDRKENQGDLQNIAMQLISTICGEYGLEIEARLGDFLAESSNRVGKERPDPSRFDYARGTATDPIPIYWFKEVSDYPSISVDGKKYKAFESFDLEVDGREYHFGVSRSNQPRLGLKLRKRAHASDRGKQKHLNKVLNQGILEDRVEIDEDPKANLSEAGGFDGDHVKDLSFSGQDVITNYWPLDAKINRAALSFNRNYLINYLDSTLQPRQAPIGVLFGKHFRVVGFGNDQNGWPVPNNSGTAAAGAKDGGGGGGKSKPSGGVSSEPALVIHTGLTDSESDSEDDSNGGD